MSNKHGTFILSRNKNKNTIKNIFKHSSNETFTLQNMPKLSKIIKSLIVFLLVIVILSLLFKLLIKKKYLLII